MHVIGIFKGAHLVHPIPLFMVENLDYVEKNGNQGTASL